MNAAPLLDLAAPPSEERYRIDLRFLRGFVFLHVAVRSFLTLEADGASAGPLRVLVALLAVAAVLVVATSRGDAPSPAPRHFGRALWALVAVEVVVGLPMTANHVFLELVVLSLLAFLDERRTGEGTLLLQGLRWVTVVLFFYSGLQKLLYGYWSDGQFLAYVAATEERFGLVLGPLMPAAELERLRSYNAALAEPGVWSVPIGAGPYRVDSLTFVLLSNFVWIFEMVCAAALLVPRLRTAATVAAVAFVVAIELGARELTFGALMTTLLLTFAPPGWVRRGAIAFALFYLYLVAHDLGWVPFPRYSPA